MFILKLATITNIAIHPALSCAHTYTKDSGIFRNLAITSVGSQE